MFKFSIITAFAISISIAALLSPALAQSGHPINSIDTTPGTSVPLAPTDPTLDPEKNNTGLLRLPSSRPSSTSEMDHDIASSQADRKASRKLSPNQQAQKKSIFPNEKTPQLSPPRPNSD